MELKKKLLAVSASAVLGIVGLIAVVQPASAYMACNNEGDCWHTEARVHAPGARFDYHPDDWYFHQKWEGDRHYREYHEGRGYYKGGVWIGL